MRTNNALRAHTALHHGAPTRVLALILTILCLVTIAGTARATSYVMVTDEDLTASAGRIVVGKVTGIDQGSNGGYHTDYAVRIQRVLKGEDPGPAVMLRVLGGEGLDGDELEVIGAPRFTVGEEAIFFLDDAQDGTYQLHQYLLGAFRRVEQDGGAVALRNLEEAEEVRLPGQRARSEANVARDFEGFAEWLTASGAGFEMEPEYFIRQPEAGVARVESAYTMIGNGTARWFEFDRG
ncbi:MAG TPA: hypothetical protein VNB06_23665, partial [Thermoanaerobaculia bacterium]|nr:hypothetical protein [Thermoanaerobaculia bacterium]